VRIAVVTHDYPTPGHHGGAFVQARVDLYRRMGHEVVVYARKHPPELWKDGGPDVLQVHYPLPEFSIWFARRFRHRLPVVAYLHGAEAIRTPDKPKLWGWKTKLATRRFVKTCDAVVTASRWMQAQAEAYLGVASTVIPNPVDDELFALNGGHRPPKALCLRGNLRKYGVDVLREATRDKHLDGHVAVLDPVYARRELPAVLERFSVFVAPSRLEGQGLMACEAAASGLKVVTTRAGGIPEFFGPMDAMFIDELTPACVGEAIHRAFDWRPDLRAIRDRVLARCGPRATVEKDVALMESLVEAQT
jgi:glycosyltransferase involved in cell wall biosynthesis